MTQQVVIQSIRHGALQRLRWQGLVSVAAAVLVAIFQGLKPSASVLMGALAAWLPARLFAQCFFSDMRPRAISRILVVFYGGEVIKLIISAGLVLLLLCYMPVAVVTPLDGLLGFGIFLVSSPLVAAWQFRRTTGRTAGQRVLCEGGVA